jgi:hypothetical protein
MPSLDSSQDAVPAIDMGTDEQLTGRAPSGPLAAAPDDAPAPATSTTPSLTGTSPNLGRVRGNTGPLGPLPPDRTGAPNTSWSDSSLASIEDFSSILIALHAGKKLRQSGSLTENMVPQDSSATLATSAPVPTPEHVGIENQVQDMPEWAVQATQSSPLTPEMAAPPAQTEQAPQPAAEPTSPEQPDSIQYRQVPADSVLNQLEPGVAEALKTMDTSVGSAGISGDDIQFEGFMFNKGASTPMASLSTPTPEELASLANELGPTFDPTSYTSVESDVEESINYDDIDPTLFEGLSDASQSQTSEATADSGGGLPFWLQFEDSPPASGPLAEQDLPDYQRMSGSAQNAVQDQSAPSSSDSQAQDDFGDLPPIEPFDFSLMPSSDTDESLGFNTEELRGMTSDVNDPMTATINLAAVDVLLGNTTSGPLDSPPPPAYEYNMDAGSDAETSLSLDTPEAWSSPSQDEQATQSQHDSSPSPSWSHDVAPELGLDSGTYSAQSAPNESPANEAPTSYMGETSADLASDPAQADAVDGSPGAGGWMASATSGLDAGNLASSTEGSAHSTAGLVDSDLSENQGLAVDELDVAPFDFTQIDVEEEPPTGYLDAQEMKSKYGTGKLETVDDNPITRDAGPTTNNWSSETDTSYFASATPTEVEIASAMGNSASFTSPLTSDLPVDRKATSTDYLGEEALADTAQPHDTAAATPETSSQAPSASDVAHEEPGEQPVIKARVARGPWTSYSEPTDLTMPAPQAHTQAQAKAQQPIPTPTPASAPSSPSGPLFEQSVRLPVESDMMTSGPLPAIAGFDDLTGLVADNPQDIGAHMALASAYAQAEDIDSALRVYRRIIKKPTTSETMLKMIWDDLSDLGPQAQHLPRYHQLSGDLLLRLGRHREAIEAYNRLQSNDSE